MAEAKSAGQPLSSNSNCQSVKSPADGDGEGMQNKTAAQLKKEAKRLEKLAKFNAKNAKIQQKEECKDADAGGNVGFPVF